MKKLRSTLTRYYKKITSYVKKHPFISVLGGVLLLLLIFRKTFMKAVVTITRKPTSNAITLIKGFEGFYSNAYLDTGGVWTIGYGTVVYKNGVKVKKGDTITKSDAEKEMLYEVSTKTSGVNYRLMGLSINDNQYDSIVSFAYNVGLGAFASSTLLKKIKANPNDPTIWKYNTSNPIGTSEFTKWVYDNGKFIQGLLNRRISEAKNYSS